jgi:pilus assembly protein CpaF
MANIRFRDEQHHQIAQRIVNRSAAASTKTTPLADARLKDGSRVNVIVPPLSLKGTLSIRKFSRKAHYARYAQSFGSMSDKYRLFPAVRVRVKRPCSRCQMIDPGERVLTIEDNCRASLATTALVTAAYVRQTAKGRRVTIGDLMKNALRMRP